MLCKRQSLLTFVATEEVNVLLLFLR